MKLAANTRKFASIRAVEDMKDLLQARSHIFTPGVGVAVLANILWGTSFLASKYTLQAWGPFTASALRFLLATVLMFLGLKIFRRKISIPRTR